MHRTGIVSLLSGTASRIGLPGLRSALAGQRVFVWPGLRRQWSFLQDDLYASGGRHLSSLFFLKTTLPAHEVREQLNPL
jgi:hypothetical protein